MAQEQLKFTGNTIEIGRERYNFTQETQQLLIPGFRSTYPKDTSVLIINEPHDSSEGHYNLYKGLTSFFKANPGLARETIFLSEGTEAEKPISMQELIVEEPDPSDQIIRQVLQSLTITGYMAYEWKTHQGIPIIGTEDQGLYELSRRFASLCNENPNALFQSIQYGDGTRKDIPLVYGWGFAIAARNKRIAQTLIDKVKKYKNPVLFVGAGHMKDPRPPQVAEAMDSFIKGRLIDAQYMGMMGAFQFPWGNAGNNWWLYRNVNNDTETHDIEHYLRQARIGYTFLNPKGYDVSSQEDEENYKRIFRLQREQ